MGCTVAIACLFRVWRYIVVVLVDLLQLVLWVLPTVDWLGWVLGLYLLWWFCGFSAGAAFLV